MVFVDAWENCMVSTIHDLLLMKQELNLYDLMAFTKKTCMISIEPVFLDSSQQTRNNVV
jgi:hypothetical protein